MSKVLCPICNKKYIEINQAHLNKHQLVVSTYDTLYPKFPRMSMERRRSKARYQILTPEMSAKLKYSHTLDGYINKYGSEEGVRRWNLVRIRASRSKTLERFIELYGEIKGKQKHSEFIETNKIKMSLQGFVLRHGEAKGKARFEQYKEIMRKIRTKEYYLSKYGHEEGQRRWDLKNLRNSYSSMKVKPEDRHCFELYKLVVTRMTRETLRNHPIKNLDLVKKYQYTIDHKFSVLEGFRNRIPPYIVASTHNLEVLSHHENSSKQEKCSLSLVELFDLFFGDTVPQVYQ